MLPSESTPPSREMMNRKPVIYRDARTVLTIPSPEFEEKLLCSGIVFNLGDACAYSCEFCYVEAAMRKIDQPLLKAHNQENGTSLDFPGVVVRRRPALQLLREQLVGRNGSPKYADPADQRVAYSSTLVDVAANMDLLRETAEACNLILDHTYWQIRLLSKSNLLHKLIADNLIPERHHQRLIFGFSTGTLDDRVAKAIETGTPLVSKRIESLHWLQDRGLRTFGMICPSLPQEDYHAFSREICDAIRIDRCEHVWAEVINLRGKSLQRTLEGLRKHGLEAQAEMIERVSGKGAGQRWEEYARETFLAHTRNVPADKLRFLQYIDKTSADWWSALRDHGAVLLGSVAKELGLTSADKMQVIPAIPLGTQDLAYRDEREEIVNEGIRASIAAAKALFEIFHYRDGLLWRQEFPTFEAYCRTRWDYGKSHSYRLVDCGDFISELESASQSPKGDWMPKSESQIRPILKLPRERRVECWRDIVVEASPAEMTTREVAKRSKALSEERGWTEPAKPKSPRTSVEKARESLKHLREAVIELEGHDRIEKLLNQVERLLE